MNPMPAVAIALVATGLALAVQQQDAPTAVPEPAQAIAEADHIGSHPGPVDTPHCEPAKVLTETLASDFAETPIVTRLAGDGLEVQLWASDLMGTWTIVHHGFDDISCVVASGFGWTGNTRPDDIFAQVSLAS
jgi:hypothetical protein